MTIETIQAYQIPDKLANQEREEAISLAWSCTS